MKEVRFATEDEAKMFIAVVRTRDASSVRDLFYYYGSPPIVLWGDVIKRFSPEDKKFFDECIQLLELHLDEEGCSG